MTIGNEKEKLNHLKDEIRKRVAEYISTEEGEYRSHSSDPVAIMELLYEYVFVYGKDIFTKRLRKLFRTDELPNIEEYSVEFIKTTHDVLKSHSFDKGDFFAYFDLSLIRSLQRAIGKDLSVEQHGGMILPYGKKARVLSKIIREFSEEISVERIIFIAKERYDTIITRAEVIEYRSSTLSLNAEVDSDTDDNEGGVEIKDLVVDQNNSRLGKELLQKEQRQAIVQYLENAYLKSQDQQRDYLGAALTARCSEWIYRNANDLLPLVTATSWFDQEVYEVYEKTGVRMEQKAIARRYEKSSSSISRAFSTFVDHYLDIRDMEELLDVFD